MFVAHSAVADDGPFFHGLEESRTFHFKYRGPPPHAMLARSVL
jgi:hypothetical protein